MNQAFHHVEPRKDFLEHLVNMVSRNGYIIFAESNAFNPFIQYGCFRMRGFKTIKTISLESGEKLLYGDERVLSASKLIRLLMPYGFKKISLRFYQLLPNNKKYTRLSYLNNLKMLPSFLFAKYVLVVQKS